MSDFNLNDQMMDEADALASMFPDLTDEEVLQHVSQSCDVKQGISSNSTGGRLVLAAYNRNNVKRMVQA